MLTTKEKKKKLTYLSKELTYEKMEQYIALLIRKILLELQADAGIGP